jgi:anti-sigma B factor antagonist
MNVETTKSDNITIVTPVVRRLDASVSQRFKESVQEIIRGGETDLLINFSRVDFIDSSSLGALVSLLKMLNGKGTLALCAMNPNLQNLFKLTRMDRIFMTFPTQDEALTKLNNR